jgi:hypothetical protein
VSRATLRILDAGSAEDSRRWEALWQSWPGREVQAHPGYARLFAGPASRPTCAAWDGPEGRVLYPFLLRPLAAEPYAVPGFENARDLATPYGYGGPFCWGAGERAALAASFWAQFDAWAREQEIVSEFVRFALFPDQLLPHPGTSVVCRRNVVRDLAPDEPSLWADYAHKVRKNVARARRSGVEVEIDATGAHLADFLRVYRATLDRRSAPAELRFTAGFLERLHLELPGRYVYFHARAAGSVVSSELVLVSEESVYSFLGGTDASAFALRPNDLLKHEIIGWARRRGLGRFVLGGGYEDDDGIFRYKRSFAPRGIVPFVVGRRVLEPAVYAELVRRRRDRERAAGGEWTPRPGYFPEYRA